MEDDNLDYAGELKTRVRMIYGPGWTGKIDPYVYNTSFEMHSLKVMDALNDSIHRIVALSELVSAERAKYYLHFGAGRRLLMIWRAYRELIFTAHPEREETLNSDESGELNTALNVIYLNIRGTLDNLAWSLMHQFAPDKIGSNPMKIGLFNACIVGNEKFSALSSVLEDHAFWEREIKQRRDPAAHQIPLSISGQVVTTKETSDYNQVIRGYEDAVRSSKFDEADRCMTRLYQIGRFAPFFSHDPEKSVTPIYPIVPNDVGRLVTLCKAVDTFLKPPQGGVNP